MLFVAVAVFINPSVTKGAGGQKFSSITFDWDKLLKWNFG